jgi:hypothetical protein
MRGKDSLRLAGRQLIRLNWVGGCIVTGETVFKEKAHKCEVMVSVPLIYQGSGVPVYTCNGGSK